MGVFFMNWFTALDGPTRKLVVRIFIFVVYLIAGAGVFRTLETGRELSGKKSFLQAKLRLMSQCRINDSELEKFIVEVRNAIDDGIFDVDFERWSFFGALFFVATVVTTIGYGHIAPRTTEGRLFCMIYAFFGIPITGLMLKSMGERLADSIDVLLRVFDKKVLHRSEEKPNNVRTSVVLLLLMVAMILTLGVAAVQYEGWTFFEGVYFAFITLSTIGFGDFIPSAPSGSGTGHHAKVLLFVAVTFIYITVGLSVVSSVLVAVSRVFENSTDWDLVSLESDDEKDDGYKKWQAEKKKLLEAQGLQ